MMVGIAVSPRAEELMLHRRTLRPIGNGPTGERFRSVEVQCFILPGVNRYTWTLGLKSGFASETFRKGWTLESGEICKYHFPVSLGLGEISIRRLDNFTVSLSLALLTLLILTILDYSELQ